MKSSSDIYKNIEFITYSVRLNPTINQVRQLKYQLLLRNKIWNLLLKRKQDLYQVAKYNISKYDLEKYLVILKEDDLSLYDFHSKAAQSVNKQIDAAYEMFFTKRKQGDLKANPPNLVDLDKQTSITYNQSGWKIKTNNRIKISKVDDPIEFFSKKNFDKANVKEVKIKYKNNKWIAFITIEKEIKVSKKKEKQGTVVFDLGLQKLAHGIDSSGKSIIILNKAKKIAKYFGKQIKKVNEKISRKTKDSKQYKYLKEVRKELYRKQVVQVEETLHIQSRKLVDMNYQQIIFGDLSISEIVQRDNNKLKNVRKSFQQSSIATFLEFVKVKAARKHITVYEVDERYTSQTNCLTMEKFPERVELGDRKLQISDEIVIERDLCSCIVMYRKISEGYVYKRGIWVKPSSQTLVVLAPPLNIIRVLEENNLFKEEVSRPGGREGLIIL